MILDVTGEAQKEAAEKVTKYVFAVVMPALEKAIVKTPGIIGSQQTAQ